MVVRAERLEVFGLGFAVVSGPVLAVMDLGPGGWPVAAGPDAAAVSGDDEVAEPGRDGAGEPAEVEDLGVGAVDGRDDSRIAGHPPGCRGGEAFAVGRSGGAETVERDWWDRPTIMVLRLPPWPLQSSA
jgi:hypothetical protein